jgi:hypothetical protein
MVDKPKAAAAAGAGKSCVCSPASHCCGTILCYRAKQIECEEYLKTSALSMYSMISGLYFLKAPCIWFSNLWLLPMLAAEGCSPGVSMNFTLTPATVPLISRILLVPGSKALVGAAASASKTLLMVALLPTPLMPMTMTVQAKGSTWSADCDSSSSAWRQAASKPYTRRVLLLVWGMRIRSARSNL